MKKNEKIKSRTMEYVFIIAVITLSLGLAGIVIADEDTSIVKNDTESNTIQGQALTVRYEHLICKVEFTDNQIDLLDNYLDENISDLKDSSEELNEYTEILYGHVQNNDKTAFNTYMESTIRPAFQEITTELNNIKNDFKEYNLSNDTKQEFLTDLKELRMEYASCVSDKETKMGKVMNKHLEHLNRQYGNSISKMMRNGLNTTEMDSIITQMRERNAELQSLIESGNITKLKEFMQKYKEETMYFATKMEIEKLKSYKAGMYSDTEKYNRMNEMRNIDNRLVEAEKQMQIGRNNSQGKDRCNECTEYDESWENIKNANKEMKELSKEILAERARERLNQQKPSNGNGMNQR
jgi:hypothetical protein